MSKWEAVVVPVFRTLLVNGWALEAEQRLDGDYVIRAERDDWLLSLNTAEGLTVDGLLSYDGTAYFIMLDDVGEFRDFARMSSEEIAQEWNARTEDHRIGPQETKED